MLDPAQGEFADALMQREASELRLGCIRRKDFHFPAAEVVDAVTTESPLSSSRIFTFSAGTW